jgi:hypothetical protein
LPAGEAWVLPVVDWVFPVLDADLVPLLPHPKTVRSETAPTTLPTSFQRRNTRPEPWLLAIPIIHPPLDEPSLQTLGENPSGLSAVRPAANLM